MKLTAKKDSSWLSSNWLFAGIMVVVILLAWGNLHQGHIWGDDFASYIMQAQSIVSGTITDFLAQNRFTIKGSSVVLGPIAYPWGTPLLLSPIIYVAGFDIQALKSLNFICLIGFLVVLWFGVKKYLSPGWGHLYFLLFALNPFLIYSLDNISSHLPFLLFSMTGVVLIRRAIVEEKFLFSRPVDLLLVGLVIAVATSIRVNGIVQLGALLLIQAIRNYQNHPAVEGGKSLIHRLAAAAPRSIRDFWMQVLPYLSFIVFTGVWNVLFPSGGSYNLNDLQKLKITTFLYHMYYYFKIPADFLTPMNEAWLIYSFFVLFTGWGILRRYAKDYDFFIYCMLTILVYLIWPFLQGLWYIFPILPLVLYFTMQGVQSSLEESPANWRKPLRWVIGLGLAGVVAVFVINLTRDAAESLKQGRIILDGPETKAAQQVLKFISSHTDENDVIIFFKPRALRLYTHRPSIIIPFPEALARGNYLLVDLAIPPDWNPVSPEFGEVLREEQKLDLIFQNEEFRLYAVTR
jgi:hypothetical protein